MSTSPSSPMPHVPRSPLAHLFAGATTQRIGAAEVAWDHGDLAAEYAAIRGSAAKIDLSGAGLVEVTGDDAYDLLQQALARDLEFVTPEQSLISLLLDGDGGAVDVVTVYHVADGYRLETAIGRGPVTVAHLSALRDATARSAQVADRAGEVALILVEGPQAARALEDGIDPDLGALPLSGIMEVELDGVELSVSRTGFTGEYGYKIFVAAADAPAVWERLADLQPAGVGALEVAMFEVRQPLLHRETPTGASALESGYAWLIDVTKESFHGRDAVVGAFESGVRSRVVGYAAPAADGAVPPGAEVRIGDEVVGESLHSVFSPGRGEWIGLARLRPELIAPHLDVTIGSSGGAGGTGGGVAARTIPAPYVVPASWKAR
jgi:glycine cleavage system aminomethyltransferase T